MLFIPVTIDWGAALSALTDITTALKMQLDRPMTISLWSGPGKPADFAKLVWDGEAAYYDTAFKSAPVAGAAYVTSLDAATPLPYKSYVVVLNQTGVTNPVATVIVNELGSMVWTRNDVGVYTLTSDAKFKAGKFWSNISGGADSQAMSLMRVSDSELTLSTYTGFIASGDPVDGQLYHQMFEIRVYP